MATNVVKAGREPLHAAPTSSLTMKREEHKQMEDLRLVSHFAVWLTSVTGVAVGAETMPEDLISGVALCKLLAMIPSSGVTKYHELPQPSSGKPLDSFKAKENMAQFQEACKRMKLPVVFGTAECEVGNLGQIASTLVFLVHTATLNGVGMLEMQKDKELRERMEVVTQATIEMAAQEAKTGEAHGDTGRQLSWWQQLLVRFGFGDWIDSLNPDSLREYADRLRAQLEEKTAEAKRNLDSKTSETRDKILEASNSFKEKLPDSVKSRLT
jgi:hypothetical protein